MPKNKNKTQKPLILDELAAYNQKVLFPAIDKRFEAIDKRFDEMDKKFEKIEGTINRLPSKSYLSDKLAMLEEIQVFPSIKS